MDEDALDVAFLAVLNDHRGAIYRVCRAYADRPDEREDLVQEVVYQLWRAFPSYRREAATITWVYRIALNTAITRLRRLGRRPVQVSLEAASHVASPLHPGLADARVELLYAAIRRLDAAGRAYVAVYVLVFVVAAAGVIGAVWWRQGFGLALAGAVASSLAAVLWSVSSGRAYVSRMFRRHRAELAECLAQLEG